MLSDLVHISWSTHSSRDRVIWRSAVFCILCCSMIVVLYGSSSIVFWRAAWSMSFFWMPKLLRTLTTRFNASFLLRVWLLAQHSMFSDIQSVKTWSHIAIMHTKITLSISTLRCPWNREISKKTPLFHIKWGFFRVYLVPRSNRPKSRCRILSRYTTSLWCQSRKPERFAIWNLTGDLAS